MELNNIIKIEYADARSIAPLFTQETLNECSISGDVEWTEIENIKVPAKMTSESVIKDKDVLDSTEVIFRTCKLLDIFSHVCLRLTLYNGAKVLVGDGKRPFGAMMYHFVHPDSATESQLREYTFRRTSKVGPMMIK